MKKVELVSGYGVFIAQKQLDQAVFGSKTATKLVRNLLEVYFSRETLAVSSAFGNRKNKALDRDIMDAVFRK